MTVNHSPLEPILEEGKDEIFVSVVSYRDGERCGKTLKAIFDYAKDPHKVFVGLIEQNKDEDIDCITRYCALQDPTINREAIKRKYQAPESVKAQCPYFSNIRYLAVYDIGAKGPTFARSLTRKLLANEEYCMQIDAHSDFLRHWDHFAKEEWKSIGNEYGVLSNIPAPISRKSSDQNQGSKVVSHVCVIGALDTDIPFYNADIKETQQNLAKPLLSYAWSAAFSFAKCHLEENVPYDNFSPQLFDAEQFPRYARMFTRGYDVYIPTQNIVYHDYGPSPHKEIDPMGWAKGWTNPEEDRLLSQERMKTLLQLQGADTKKGLQANLGLYGLGKRRTLTQLKAFTGFDFSIHHDKNRRNLNDASLCSHLTWVPYDLSISAEENLFDDADDLDPQPEYPLRTRKQLPLPPLIMGDKQDTTLNQIMGDFASDLVLNESSKPPPDSPSFLWVFPLWLVGLLLWYRIYGTQSLGAGKTIPRKRGVFGKTSIKDV